MAINWQPIKSRQKWKLAIDTELMVFSIVDNAEGVFFAEAVFHKYKNRSTYLKHASKMIGFLS